MSDVSQGPGWWIASDGKWYPPQTPPAASFGTPIVPKKRRGRLYAVIGVLVVLGIVGVVGAVVNSNSVRPNSLAVGACINDLPALSSSGATRVSTVTRVDCSKPHHFELIAIQKNPAPDGASYPGDATMKSETQGFCHTQFESYVGIASDSSSYDSIDLRPTSDSWGQGDRSEQCYVGLQNGQLTGTVKGTNK